MTIEYKCEHCGNGFDDPFPYPEPYGDHTPVCPYCYCDVFYGAAAECDRCGGTIYEDGKYFRDAEGACLCEKCMTIIDEMKGTRKNEGK